MPHQPNNICPADFGDSHRSKQLKNLRDPRNLREIALHYVKKFTYQMMSIEWQSLRQGFLSRRSNLPLEMHYFPIDGHPSNRENLPYSRPIGLTAYFVLPTTKVILLNAKLMLSTAKLISSTAKLMLPTTKRMLPTTKVMLPTAKLMFHTAQLMLPFAKLMFHTAKLMLLIAKLMLPSAKLMLPTAKLMLLWLVSQQPKCPTTH